MFCENTDKAGKIVAHISLKLSLMTTSNRSREAKISLNLFCTIIVVA